MTKKTNEFSTGSSFSDESQDWSWPAENGEPDLTDSTQADPSDITPEEAAHRKEVRARVEELSKDRIKPVKKPFGPASFWGKKKWQEMANSIESDEKLEDVLYKGVEAQMLEEAENEMKKTTKEVKKNIEDKKSILDKLAASKKINPDVAAKAGTSIDQLRKDVDKAHKIAFLEYAEKKMATDPTKTFQTDIDSLAAETKISPELKQESKKALEKIDKIFAEKDNEELLKEILDDVEEKSEDRIFKEAQNVIKTTEIKAKAAEAGEKLDALYPGFDYDSKKEKKQSAKEMDYNQKIAKLIKELNTSSDSDKRSNLEKQIKVLKKEKANFLFAEKVAELDALKKDISKKDAPKKIARIKKREPHAEKTDEKKEDTAIKEPMQLMHKKKEPEATAIPKEVTHLTKEKEKKEIGVNMQDIIQKRDDLIKLRTENKGKYITKKFDIKDMSGGEHFTDRKSDYSEWSDENFTTLLGLLEKYEVSEEEKEYKAKNLEHITPKEVAKKFKILGKKLSSALSKEIKKIDDINNLDIGLASKNIRYAILEQIKDIFGINKKIIKSALDTELQKDFNEKEKEQLKIVQNVNNIADTVSLKIENDLTAAIEKGDDYKKNSLAIAKKVGEILLKEAA